MTTGRINQVSIKDTGFKADIDEKPNFGDFMRRTEIQLKSSLKKG